MRALNILLLEDEPFDSAIIQKVLSLSGMAFTCTIVSDKDEYVDAIRKDTFDVILADNYLPQFNATKAMELLHGEGLDTPIILVTGTVSEEFAVSMIKAGVYDYILKDRLQRLPMSINAAIEKHALEADKKRYLDNLIRNEALMKRSEQLAHIGSWEADLVTLVSNWSEENYRILDYIPGEDVPTLEKFLRRVHRDDRRSVIQQIDDGINNAESCKFRCRIVNAKSSVRHLENEMFVTRDKNGRAIHVNGFSIDITERVLAEDSLRRSEANLRTIFDNTDTGFALLDTSLRVVSFNQPVYLFSQEQMAQPLQIGDQAIQLFKPERRAVVTRILNDALNGITHRYEVPYPQPDGSNKWFYTCSHPVIDEHNNVIGIIMSEADVTKRKMAELQEKAITEDLIQRNNALEQFNYIISHNLRGPMTTIMGITDLLEDDNLKDEDKSYFITGIGESIRKLDSVVVDLNNILELKNMENGSREQVVFQDIIDDVVRGIDGITDMTGVSITTDLEVTGMCTAKSYINSIFYNLISNSVKYKQPAVRSVISISSKRIQNKLLLTFQDNGLGIDMQKKGDQLFGLYKRFHLDAAEGKGIGLFMVRTQVEMLGGKIAVHSEINKGARFQIEFDVLD